MITFRHYSISADKLACLLGSVVVCTDGCVLHSAEGTVTVTTAGITGCEAVAADFADELLFEPEAKNAVIHVEVSRVSDLNLLKLKCFFRFCMALQC